VPAAAHLQLEAVGVLDDLVDAHLQARALPHLAVLGRIWQHRPTPNTRCVPNSEARAGLQTRERSAPARRPRAAHLGFGRIVASEIEVPNMLAILE
jgi:hypothetical protein